MTGNNCMCEHSLNVFKIYIPVFLEIYYAFEPVDIQIMEIVILLFYKM